MCRYVIGQKIELWHIEGGKHPHRVDQRLFVTVSDLPVEQIRTGTRIQKLVAHDLDGRRFEKLKADWMGEGALSIFMKWQQIDAEQTIAWIEAVYAVNYAYHNARPFHYWDGHGHELKPAGGAHYCKVHHVWEQVGLPCPDSGIVVRALDKPATERLIVV